MIEAISIAHAKQIKKNLETRSRSLTIFDSSLYKSPIVHRNLFLKDMNNKNSPYYIRKKIEIGVVAMEVANKNIKIGIVIILSIYMYGAICLKYVSGAESL